MSTEGTQGQREAARFHSRLLWGMMLVIVSITMAVLYFAQRRLEAQVQARDQEQFRSRLDFLLLMQRTHEDVIGSRCARAARSVRIRAALEEGSLEDLYLSAKVELQDLVQRFNREPYDETSGGPPPASWYYPNFFYFVDAHGKMLPDPAEKGASPTWKLAPALRVEGLSQQSNGYMTMSWVDPKESSTREEIATPIFGTEKEELIGAIVVGFRVSQQPWKSSPTGIRNALWFDDHLQIPFLPGRDLSAIEQEVRPYVQKEAEDTPTVWVEGQPFLLFRWLLNPGSSFPPAWQLCFYPLSETVAREHELRWKVLLVGALAALVGLAASHVLARRMAAPVSQFAADSAVHREQREKAEAALQVSEEKYRHIFENAVEGIFLLAEDGRFLEANPALARIYGYPSPEQFCAGYRESTLPSAAEGEQQLEMEARRRDGSRIWLFRRSHPVRDAAGALLHFEGTVEEITERKRAADALLAVNAELEVALANLRATQQQVIEQERLRALGEMASGIAHDFNNTLVPILGFCELLLINPKIFEQPKKAITYLETIQTAARDAASVVARLRQFYRADKGDHPFQPVNLEQLVRQTVALTQPKWKDQAQAKGATIQIQLELGQVPQIAGDESALREAMTNLIFNAVDAMPQGGALTLRTWMRKDTVAIEVADSGQGMTEEVRRRCLEPFFSTKGDRGGTGLGLAMVFGIVKRHSGRLDLASEVGKGTTFTLSFPVPHQPLTATGEAPKLGSHRSLRVLVVDDDELVRETLGAVLDADDHRVTQATDGAEGLRLFVAGTFDLVITDKAMPNMSGDQMAKAIKRVSPRTPIILLTGFGLFHEKSEFPGVDVLASKPVRIPALRAAIEAAMGGDSPA